jgi:hypothetical protein
MKRMKIPGIIRRRLLASVSVIILVTIVLLVFDYRGPGHIKLKRASVFGMPCSRASDLVVQEYDNSGNLWATRGMIIYCLRKDSDRFERVAHVPTGFNIFWLRNFSLLRKITIRPECMEVTVTGNGDLFAVSGGSLWISVSNRKQFRRIFTLSHYGFGDQGVRSAGILNYNDSIIYLGEYYTNKNRDAIRVFEYSIVSDTVKIAYEFEPGQIRHVHAIQKDYFTGRIWICTGDLDSESAIAWTDNGFNTVNYLFAGSQTFRVCQLVFTDNNLYWGTDTGIEQEAGIFRALKSGDNMGKLNTPDGAVFYATRLNNGIIVFSTDREGLENEKDDKTRLFIINGDNKVTEIEGGTWKHKNPGLWFKYSFLRLQRDQGATSLAVTFLNQKEFNESELIIFSEESLQSVAGGQKPQRNQ